MKGSCMKQAKINYLVISDIHLGHHVNKTEFITNNLRAFFLKYNKFFSKNKLDIIFIAGDIFDRLLPSSGHDFIEASKWLSELIFYCKTNKIKLRILEGTPSHDWKQAKLIFSIIEKLDIQMDYKYIDTLYIEDMVDLGLTVLYIPDEYKHNAEDTYKDVKKLLKSLNMSQVDIAIMHGAFDYQIPFKLESNHNEENYLSIVKHYISIGHVHTSSVRDRILAQGSFDRLKHNEEEVKGAMFITLQDSGDSCEFLPNENAMKFITLKYENKDLDFIVKDVSKKCESLPVRSNIRILTNNYKDLNKNINSFKDKFVTFKFKIENLSKDDTEKFTLLEKKIVNDSFSITKENITELLTTEMDKHSLSENEKAIFQDELSKVL